MASEKELNDRLKIFQKRFEEAFNLHDARKIMKFYHKNVVIVGENGVITGRQETYNNFKKLFQTQFSFKITVTSNKETEGGNRWIQKGIIEFRTRNEGNVQMKFEQQCRLMPNKNFLIDAVTNFETKRF